MGYTLENGRRGCQCGCGPAERVRRGPEGAPLGTDRCPATSGDSQAAPAYTMHTVAEPRTLLAQLGLPL